MPIILKAELLSGRNPRGGLYYFPSQLLTFAERLKNWRPFWVQRFAPKYLEQVQQNFATEGGLVGGWPGLSPRYAAWKARHFPGTKILERTRRLRESLAPSAISGNRDLVLQVGPRDLRIGTRVPAGRFVVRQRPFLPPIREAEWRWLFNEWIDEQAKNA